MSSLQQRRQYRRHRPGGIEPGLEVLFCGWVSGMCTLSGMAGVTRGLTDTPKMFYPGLCLLLYAVLMAYLGLRSWAGSRDTRR